MKTFLEADGGHFHVYSDTFAYLGTIEKSDGTWTCHSERRIQDLSKDVVAGVDEILDVLNSS